MASMTENNHDKPHSASGLERTRLLAEQSGIAPVEPLLDAVAERLAILLEEMDRVSEEQLQGVEPATSFSADAGPSDA